LQKEIISIIAVFNEEVYGEIAFGENEIPMDALPGEDSAVLYTGLPG
jgi:hypothetical protein